VHDYRLCRSVNEVCSLLQFYAAFYVLCSMLYLTRSTFYAASYSKREQMSGLQYRVSVEKYVEIVIP